MLQFLRKHQRYFFFIITVVIVISFSFFGTYSTLTTGIPLHAPAFTAVDGTSVTRGELDEMVNFISTDNEDKIMLGGSWGPNFLNDGVLRKDFMLNGVLGILAAQYPAEIKEDLQSRFLKEQRFSSYTHPQAKFVNAENVWAYFAPELKTNLDTLRISIKPTDTDAFNARINLFLAERRFPAASLKQVLRYQEKQYNWIRPDNSLDYADLSLFGYHNAEDWFGPRLIRLTAEFIINSAKMAEAKGYQVTSEEALVDLLNNADISFQQNRNNPNLGVANSEEYFREQLRRLGIDQSHAVKIWRQVLLFRRYFNDVGQSVFVDPLAYQKFNSYSKESVEGDLYQLPEAMRLGSFGKLQQFEIYLNAVAKREDQSSLALPKTFNSASEVARQYPELVQKRYLVEISEANKKALQAKVGVKETWNWEVIDSNWELLKKQFPDLGLKKGDTREQRFAALDALDDNTRSKVDTFARSSIVDANPEWIQNQLQKADVKKKEIAVRLKGGEVPLAGLKDREQLIRLLDSATLNEVQPKLQIFTLDDQMYYRINVLERTPELEVLTFAEASQDGTLEQIVDKKLENYYMGIQLKYPEKFQKADKTYKELADVKDAVAELYFDKILSTLRNEYLSLSEKKVNQKPTADQLAPYRLYGLVRDARAMIQKNPAQALGLYSETKNTTADGILKANAVLGDQWKLEKNDYRTDRSSLDSSLFAQSNPFTLTINEWSQVYTPSNGDLSFFVLKKKWMENDTKAISTNVDMSYFLLGSDIERNLMKKLLQEMQNKNAISLDYLNQSSELSMVE